ncbi:MAG: hypothetical protein JWN40_5567 [Phycisphaerales bacterium]|nr:hypothetical protein [Phycisphaerales bacterium]
MKRALVLLTLVLPPSPVPAEMPPTVKTQHFDQDPNWDAHNNRITPKKTLTVHQDFGYTPTHFAGQAPGELGGTIQRSTTPASYAAKIAPRTLDDKFSAAGSFAVTASQPGAGVFFGFFNANQPGGSGRPIGSLGLDFDFEAAGGRLALRLITADNQSCGTFITPFLPGKFRPTPIKNDGTRYHWTLDYDPAAGANNNGQFTFTLSSDNHPIDQKDDALSETHRAEALRRFPHVNTFTVDLPPAFKKSSTTFDRFGLHNMMKSGGHATIYFDDLTFAGQTESFDKDPQQWIAQGNRTTFEDKEPAGVHNFGYSKTNHAGGEKEGEIGGALWRGGPFAYYADKVGPLDLAHPFQASGKIKLITAGPDSDICLGFFNSATAKENEKGNTANFVGIHIGGPTRVGHYFAPALTSATGVIQKLPKGPLLVPGKPYDWSLEYDPAPAADHPNGQIRVRLGKETVTLPLNLKEKTPTATLDRFGLFTITEGGQMVKVYLDDLTYTNTPP